MIETPVIVGHEDGIEGRPIALLVQEASQYASKVYIQVDNKKINAKSIMGMMTLGLAPGEEVTVAADGADEEAAERGCCGSKVWRSGRRCGAVSAGNCRDRCA